jgi:Fis family transcriptional regulator
MHRNTLSRTLAELDMDTAQIRNGMRRPPRSERPHIQNIANAR